MFIFGFFTVCYADETTEQVTTVITSEYEQEILEHLESIDLYVQNTFKWVFGCCFCLIILLVILAVIIICATFSRLIM